VVEAFFTSKGFDNGQMVLDFGLMKGTIKDIISSFELSYSLWNKESEKFKTFMKKECNRWVEMPVSPSAEAYSLMFLFVLDKIIQATEFNNGEKGVSAFSVRVAETATGCAQSFKDDLSWAQFDLEDIVFSDDVKNNWNDPEMYDKLIRYHKNTSRPKPFVNKIVEQQV